MNHDLERTRLHAAEQLTELIVSALETHDCCVSTQLALSTIDAITHYALTRIAQSIRLPSPPTEHPT